MKKARTYKTSRLMWITSALLLFTFAGHATDHILVEAESFNEKGGWVIDQQSFDNLGSSYLLAHGMGVPVPNAVTDVQVERAGDYHVWVRTKDWAPFPKGPGKFNLVIDGKKVDRVFGSDGSEEWRWYQGGKVKLDRGSVRLELEDLTGFEGRCDAILLTLDPEFRPPNSKASLESLRVELLDFLSKTEDLLPFDVVVVGGGIAGITTAVQSSRLGLKVALIQNRPVLGGNNSSEIRVHLMGDLDKNHYPKLGRIVRELDNGDPENANPDARAYGDKRKLEVVLAEKNVSLFLSTHAHGVEMEGDRIVAVLARNIETNKEYRFRGTLFADCTGDGTLGYLAGADYRLGRESQSETGETMAPEEADDFTMGSSNLWNAAEEPFPSEFPETPWALPFSDEYHMEGTRSRWTWETGFGNFNTVLDAEKIRDHNFRAIYGNWSYLKNHKKEKYANWKLNWVAYISGKRESRRLMGDHILTQQDLQDHVIYPDGVVTTTWSIDLHFPDSVNSKYFPGEEFISWFVHPEIKPYPVPYRCLYSRNIDNLMMAGRNISVTHVALGTIRVMRTTGMMGEVLGHAAYLCIKHETDPRGVYEEHLDEMKEMLGDILLFNPE
jgi:hypothetical protein